MSAPCDFDVVVIGAGHNGLAATALLAGRGLRVLCVEKNAYVGGMAGTPKRAPAAEAALIGRPFDADGVARAAEALREDFQPLDDLRASADYRLQAAAGCLERFRLQLAGVPSRIEEVA